MCSRRLIFITHGDVLIDPEMPVPDWGLNPRGRARHEAFVQSGALDWVNSVWSSAEQKAMDGAQITAHHLKVPHHILEALHENDRSATGFLPEAEFQATADAFFAHPEQSIRGWEPAQDAQTRVVQACKHIVSQTPDGDVAVVAHGGVGCLLVCHVLGVPISRTHDQPGRTGGNYVTINLPDWTLLHYWQDIAALGEEP